MPVPFQTGFVCECHADRGCLGLDPPMWHSSPLALLADLFIAALKLNFAKAQKHKLVRCQWGWTSR